MRLRGNLHVCPYVTAQSLSKLSFSFQLEAIVSSTGAPVLKEPSSFAGF